MSVVRESNYIQLCRNGYVIVGNLHQELDMTEVGIARTLNGSEDRPTNNR
jgi:hypothetical protein